MYFFKSIYFINKNEVLICFFKKLWKNHRKILLFPNYYCIYLWFFMEFPQELNKGTCTLLNFHPAWYGFLRSAFYRGRS